MKRYLKILSELGKFRITFFVAFSTAIGYILFNQGFDLNLIYPSIGVFLLASGSSAFNHLQERKTDALMDRTRNRPLPSGRVTPEFVIAYAFILVLAGSGLLLIFGNVIAFILGLTALFWYNIIYTPLKRKYVLAVVPGSLIGAIPPVIGWVAAGGDPLAIQALALALFFFIWQIPHFWLLLMLFSKDYEKAGFPTLTNVFNNDQLSRITFIWIAALSASCLLIPVFDISSSIFTTLVMLALGIWLVWDSKEILNEAIEKIVFKKAFLKINLYVLAVVFVLSFDKLVL